MKRAGLVLFVTLVIAAIGFFPDLQELRETPAKPGPNASTDMVRRGEYLALAGNCQHCHTRRGGEAYAGGRAIETPFGTVFSSNLTADPDSGLGRWSADDFWRAMHEGRSRDGHSLVPAFPFVNFTWVRREDSDALLAWLKTVTPVAQKNRSHELRWPYGTSWAMSVWRALFFTPQTWRSDPLRSAQWNRGAYLVQGLGHCNACHTSRNFLGAGGSSDDLNGGLIPMQNWYAPALTAETPSSVQSWEAKDIALWLEGVSSRRWASGPMAEVVLHSTQYLTSEDRMSVAAYLKELPTSTVHSRSTQGVGRGGGADATGAGAEIYRRHCSACHGAQGQGVANAYPALAGNSAVTLANSTNSVQIVLNGGFAPATRGNPRPFGMPPFALILSDQDIALVLSFVRSSWGNSASEISPGEVDRLRSNVKR